MNAHQPPQTSTTIHCMIDKVYRAVIAENQALDAYKYHLVGGAAGTVSPSKLYLHLCKSYMPTTFFLLILSYNSSSLFHVTTMYVVGWTFQGGNGATMGDRLYGTCVYYLLP